MNTSGSSNARFGAELFFAAGEEKTTMQLPKGYGYPLRADRRLFLNHMIHNLTPVPTQVYMVYQIDFAPKGSPAARGIRPVRPVWMDVERERATRSSTSARAPAGRAASPTRTDAKNPYGGGPEAEPVGRGQAGRAGRHRRPPASRAGSTRT